MTNFLREIFLQAGSLGGEVLEQAVNLVTNDNLDLGCAVIEKSATEKVPNLFYVCLYYSLRTTKVSFLVLF